MMEIGVLGDPRAAQALVDYMRAQGIQASTGPAEDGVSIQVSGSLSGVRSKDAPLLSQVLEADHQALISAIGELLRRGR